MIKCNPHPKSLLLCRFAPFGGGRRAYRLPRDSVHFSCISLVWFPQLFMDAMAGYFSFIGCGLLHRDRDSVGKVLAAGGGRPDLVQASSTWYGVHWTADSL